MILGVKPEHEFYRKTLADAESMRELQKTVKPAFGYIARNMKPGQIVLEGQVDSFDAKSGMLTLTATGFTNPGGRSQVLKPTTKSIRITKTTLFFRVPYFASSSTAALLPGRKLKVLGDNEGSGKPMTARQINIDYTDVAGSVHMQSLLGDDAKKTPGN